MITCLECNKQYKRLNIFHLRYHGLTEKSYLEKYPNAKLYFDGYRELISQKTKEGMWSKDTRNKFLEGIKNRKPTTENLGKYVQKGRKLTKEEYNKSYSKKRNEQISKARKKFWSENKGKTVEELWGEEKGKSLRKWQSENRQGENNPAFGKVYEKSGGKIGKYKGLLFRGIWELSYWKYLEKLGFKINSEEEIKYEPFKLKYISQNRKRTYTPDFLNKKEKKLVEIKSKYKFLEMSDELQAKKQAAEKWCQENGYSYHILTEKDFTLLTHAQACADKDIKWIRK